MDPRPWLILSGRYNSLISIAQDLGKGAIPNIAPLGKGQGRKEVR